MVQSNEPAKSHEQLLARIAAATGLSKQHVAAFLEALAAEIERNLSSKGAGLITIPGVAKIERKTVPACPTWPASVKVTVVPELLPGPDKDCARGLHTYHKSPSTNRRGHPLCGMCGKDEIDWKRLHKRKIADIQYTVAQLRTDRFRHEWWFKDIDPKAVQHARRKGQDGIEEAVRKRVTSSVGRVYELPNGKKQPYHDGWQTTDKVGKMNIIHYGQHATANCCRECMEVWHGIPQGRNLTEEEVDYVVDLLLTYIRFKLPELRED